ncbi:hypothetical protein [Microbacterium sp. NPDC087665]|uniref:hypothetical protein n=1 Tax=Microbacterium sp. NPDC087665 TaxID=3364194 RepID=UPI0038065EC3
MTDPSAPHQGFHPAMPPQQWPSQPQPPQPAPPARSTKGRTVIWIVVAAAVLVALIVGGLVVVNTVTRGPSAQEVAEEYLAHISDGDAAAAAELVAAQPEETEGLSDPSLLTDEVLGAAVERISGVVVEPASGSDDAQTFATFDVSYTLAGETYETSLSLVRGEGEGLAPGSWQIRRAMTDLFIVTQGDPPFLLSGVEMQTVESGEFLPLALYPAVYPISAVDPTFFETDRDELVITGGSTMPEKVSLVPNQHFTDEVQRQVDAFLDDCTTQTTWRPEGCPFDAPLDARTVEVQWTIETYPTVELLLDGEMFDADGGSIRAVYTPPGATEPVTVEDELGTGGTIEIDGSALSLTFP